VNDQQTALALAGLAVLCVLLGVALLVAVVRLRGAAARSRAEVDGLRERLERLEQSAARSAPAAAPPTAPVEFVITDLGRPPEPDPEQARIDGAAFADVVLKETVVKAASLAHGVRRGLAPATRNRIRFEMKQEVRRSRKQRRADLKAAQRDLHARQRAALAADRAEAAS
jgi:hypothetical protein